MFLSLMVSCHSHNTEKPVWEDSTKEDYNYQVSDTMHHDTIKCSKIDSVAIQLHNKKEEKQAEKYKNRKVEFHKIFSDTHMTDTYNIGYERGYADGEKDAHANAGRNSFNTSNQEKGKNRLRYVKGYKEGYEAGYTDNLDSGD